MEYLSENALALCIHMKICLNGKQMFETPPTYLMKSNSVALHPYSNGLA